VGVCNTPLQSAGAQDSDPKAYPIIQNTIEARSNHEKFIKNYQAEVYIKGSTQVKKRNALYPYAPSLLYLDRHGNSRLIECLINIQYRSPTVFSHEMKAINGRQTAANDIQNRILPFLDVNIYNPSIINDQLLIPETKLLFEYYDFKYTAQLDTLEHTIHQIELVPKARSQRLLSGYFYIVDGSWNIYRTDIQGRWEFYNFRVNTTYGIHSNDFLLPLQAEISFDFNMLGNHTKSLYEAYYTYQSVEYNRAPVPDFGLFPINRNSPKRTAGSPNYNLTTRSDTTYTIPYVQDSLFWAQKRPVPLTAYEQFLVDQEQAVKALPDSFNTTKSSAFLNLTTNLVVPQNYTHENTNIEYSGLLNPLKFGYSHDDGIIYWQELSLFYHRRHGQEYLFKPSVGYMFRDRKFYFKTPFEWLFLPKKMGKFFATFGNREQSYNSDFLDQIKQETGKTVDIDSLNLDYYQHYYSELSAQYEISNGFLISGGINYDWYIPVKKNTNLPDGTGENEVLVIDNYHSFAPVIRLQWTPGQYYRFKGKHKEYLNSKYPTFQLSYAQSIRGVLNSDSHYKRFEGAMQQKIPMGLLSSFQYYIGAGGFTDTKSTYFADFELFQRQNIPQSWNDPIGGTFHVLSNEWYHAADSYIQAHFMYESPLLFLKLFKNAPKDILNERLYFSQLYTPALPCYTEIGYGLGNFFCNAGLFVSLDHWKVNSIGGKFSVDF
jgi:hypothetical protein